MVRLMRVVSMLVVAVSLSGCALYFGNGDDDADDWADDGPFPPTDAGTVPPDADAWAQCLPPDPGKLTVCGRIHDVENGAATSAAPHFYDAIELAGAPTAAAPLAVESIELDGDGTFVAHDVTFPTTSSMLAVAIDDDPAADADVYRQTMIAMPVAPGQRIVDVRAYVVRTATDQLWALELGASPTLVDQGAFLGCFADLDGVPAAGVQITESGTVETTNDFYFGDTSATTRQQIAPPMNASGANGCGLKLQSALSEHSGVGGAPLGCWWSSHLAHTVPGVLWVQDYDVVCGE